VDDTPGSARSDRFRAEYAARIHRVVDFVERHLDRAFTLDELARIACFSPFHFHRVFTAFTGEPLYQFILRLRLERAASQLLQNPGKSVTAVALDCGFGSPAAFARAFRRAFGTTATAWRRASRKECEALRKEGKDRPSLFAYDRPMAAATDAGGAPKRRKAMTTGAMTVKEAQQVRIETLAPTAVAYIRHVGPYAGDAALFGRLFGRLCGWAGPRGLLGPSTRMLTIYHDNPQITEEEKLRISVCATVPPGTAAEGEVGVMQIDGGKYAVASFELDPGEYGAAWNWLMGTWLPSSGCQPDDRPCFEMYLNDPKTHPAHKHIVEIWEPVRPL
jgi:AraC family transcriptional regulator